MPLILNIETATEVCSVALADNGKLISLEEETKANSHSSILTILIQRLFEKANLTLDEIAAVSVSEGPGSYTGLRIGVSAAKGLCYALDKPLIAVSTLKEMAYGAIQENRDDNALYCPVLDSIKDEVFAAVYSSSLQQVAAPLASGADLKNLLPLLGKSKVIISGPNLSKMKPSENMKLLYLPNSAKNMVALSEEHFAKGEFCQLESFEPAYLKNFIPRIQGT